MIEWKDAWDILFAFATLTGALGLLLNKMLALKLRSIYMLQFGLVLEIDTCMTIPTNYMHYQMSSIRSA